MTELDKKINEVFAGVVVRKDLCKAVKGNAVVPSYVLEYLLGQYCATDDEETISKGQDSVRNILAKHYVHRSEAELIKSMIREKGRHKIIDKVTVNLNEKKDIYEASFFNMGLKKIPIREDLIKRHPKLLVGGVWSITDIEYDFDEGGESPWCIDSLKPIQVSGFDMNQLIAGRKQFTTDEWLDLLLQTLGFDPELFSKRNKLFQLIRLVAFCERNYNMIELGPKGTGKSHVYSEFSPHGILISGGEVTVAKLFVNNSNSRIGLVGFWDTVAFDEFAGKDKKVDKSLVDIMKNYMANKSFSRGTESVGAEASMTFVGNTKRSVPHMLKSSNLFVDLPDKYLDSAFLDRLHYYIPGWEVQILRGEMFTSAYGFIVDYYAEVLKHFRNEDFSQVYKTYFQLDESIATRDRTAIEKTFSGLYKVIFPHDEATKEEIKELLEFAIEGRRRVKTQIMRIDETFTYVDFKYLDLESKTTIPVKTLEEYEYPQFCGFSTDNHDDGRPQEKSESETPKNPEQPENAPLEAGKQVVVKENQKGVGYRSLFGPYLQRAARIEINDPYIRKYYQIRNLFELITIIQEGMDPGDEIIIHLTTKHDPHCKEDVSKLLDDIAEGADGTGIIFTYDFDQSESFHARSIITDTGWKIVLDRGLDIFQNFETGNRFNLACAVQEQRLCKAFEITYLKTE